MDELEKAIRDALPDYRGTQVTKDEYEWLVGKLYDAYDSEMFDDDLEVDELDISAGDIEDMCDAGTQKMVDIYERLSDDGNIEDADFPEPVEPEQPWGEDDAAEEQSNSAMSIEDAKKYLMDNGFTANAADYVLENKTSADKEYLDLWVAARKAKA